MVTAYGYLRVSGRGQLAGTGPDRQREEISNYARKQNIKILDWFQDAYTGTDDCRDGLTALLAEMFRGPTKTMIVECMDRIARDNGVQTTILAKLESKKCRLISAVTGDDVTARMRHDPISRAMVQMQGVFAELEKNLIVQKLKKGREAIRKKNGRCEGRKPFGFFQHERRCWRLIRFCIERRYSISETAEVLNRYDFKTRTGINWDYDNLKQIYRRTEKQKLLLT